MGLTARCSICKKSYDTSPKDFRTESATMKDGKEVSLVWVKCPMCGKEYIVSLGDENTEPFEQNLHNLKAKALKMSRCGQRVHRKLLNKISAIDRKLCAMRKALVDRYNGTLYVSKTDGETKDLCYLQQ